MAEIILYLTKKDATTIVEWLNSEDGLVWIIKDTQQGNKYRWKAVHKMEDVESKEYCLWKVDSGSLRIPSRRHDIDDAIVLDPFSGWEQTLDTELAEVPWFGSAALETFGFVFRENGKENGDAIGRSGFNWIGNYFGIIGNGAPDDCKKWWERLKRYVKKNSTGIPWPGELGSGRTGAYAFEEAYTELTKGRPKDVNP